jgi:hypothetical protein
VGTTFLPNVSYLADLGGATGDAYTAVRHLAAGDYKEAARDAGEAVLGVLPIGKVKTLNGLNIQLKVRYTKGAKTLVDLKNMFER